MIQMIFDDEQIDIENTFISSTKIRICRISGADHHAWCRIIQYPAHLFNFAKFAIEELLYRTIKDSIL